MREANLLGEGEINGGGILKGLIILRKEEANKIFEHILE